MPWSPLSTADGTGEPLPAQLPQLLDQVLAGLGAPSAAGIVAVHEHWVDIVGEELLGHTRPVAIEDKRLRVSVDSPAWASHLRWSEREVLDRLDRLLGSGTVTAVVTRLERH